MGQLVECAANGDLERMQRALDAGDDINGQDDRGQTPVMAATYANQVDAVRLLFERGAAPDIQDDMLNTPFLYAGAEGLLDVLKLANDAGADPAVTNRYGGVAIIPAAEHGHLDVIHYLLDHTSIDVNHVNKLGWTALMEAVILSDGGPVQQEVVRVLLRGGADARIADHDGVTPLEHAQRRGYIEIVDILRDAEASRSLIAQE